MEGADLMGENMALDIDNFGDIGGELGGLPSPLFSLLGPSPSVNGVDASPMNLGSLSGMTPLYARITPMAANISASESSLQDSALESAMLTAERAARPAPRLSAPPPPHNPTAAAAVGLLAIPSPITASQGGAEGAEVVLNGKSRGDRGGRGNWGGYNDHGEKGGEEGEASGRGRHCRRNSDPSALAPAAHLTLKERDAGSNVESVEPGDTDAASTVSCASAARLCGAPAGSEGARATESTDDYTGALVHFHVRKEPSAATSEIQKSPKSSAKRKCNAGNAIQRRQRHRRSQSEPIASDWMEEMGLFREFGLGNAMLGSDPASSNPLMSTEWASIPEKQRCPAVSASAARIPGPGLACSNSNTASPRLLPLAPAVSFAGHGQSVIKQRQFMASFTGFSFQAQPHAALLQHHASFYPSLSPRAALLASKRGFRASLPPGSMKTMYSAAPSTLAASGAAVATTSAAMAAVVATVATATTSPSTTIASAATESSSFDMPAPPLSCLRTSAPSYMNAFASVEYLRNNGSNCIPSSSRVEYRKNSRSLSSASNASFDRSCKGLGLSVGSNSNSFENLEGDEGASQAVGSVISLKGIAGAGSVGSFDLNETDTMLRTGALIDVNMKSAPSFSAPIGSAAGGGNEMQAPNQSNRGCAWRGRRGVAYAATQRRRRAHSSDDGEGPCGNNGGDRRAGRPKVSEAVAAAAAAAATFATEENTGEEENRGRYRCGRCGKFKVNHVCSFVVETACRSVDVQADPTVPVIKTGRERTINVRKWGGGAATKKEQEEQAGVLADDAMKTRSRQLSRVAELHRVTSKLAEGDIARYVNAGATPMSTVVTAEQIRTSLEIMQQQDSILAQNEATKATGGLYLPPPPPALPRQASLAMAAPDSIRTSSFAPKVTTPMTPMTAALAFSPAAAAAAPQAPPCEKK